MTHSLSQDAHNKIIKDREAQAKQARAKEAREKQEKIKDTMAVLDWQKQTREIQRAQEQDIVKREQAMLQEQWAIEEQKEKQDAEQRFLLNRERNLELIQHNAMEKQLREQAVQADLSRDKVLLNAAL